MNSVDPEQLQIVHRALRKSLGIKKEVPISEEHFATATRLDFQDGPLNSNGLLALEKCIQLSYLELSRTFVQDLSPLAALQFLQFLNLSSTPVQDITALQNLKSLEQLHLWETEVEDVSPLQGLTCLRSLILGRTKVHDISPLRDLVMLEGLWLECTLVDDISALAKLTKLTELSLPNQIRDLSPLQNMSEMYELLLGSSTHALDLKPLKEMRKLWWLALSNCPIQSLLPIRNLHQLRHLYLKQCIVKPGEVDELRVKLPHCEIYGP